MDLWLWPGNGHLASNPPAPHSLALWWEIVSFSSALPPPILFGARWWWRLARCPSGHQNGVCTYLFWWSRGVMRAILQNSHPVHQRDSPILLRNDLCLLLSLLQGLSSLTPAPSRT